jgi:hypothetical protein
MAFLISSSVLGHLEGIKGLVVSGELQRGTDADKMRSLGWSPGKQGSRLFSRIGFGISHGRSPHFVEQIITLERLQYQPEGEAEDSGITFAELDLDGGSLGTLDHVEDFLRPGFDSVNLLGEDLDGVVDQHRVFFAVVVGIV